MQQAAQATFDMIRAIKQSSAIKVNRNFDGFFSDRIIQALAEPTLLAAIERLTRSVDSQLEYLGGNKIAAFMAAAQSDQAASILAWLRRHPRVAAMIAMLRNDDEYAEAISGLEIEQVSVQGVAASTAFPVYDIPITVRTLSPLAHGGDTKAGNATLFRRRQVLTSTGGVIDLPYYAGNAIRGQMRDLLADDLLSQLGVGIDRTKPAVSLWFFHTLYAGGVLDESGAKITAKLEAALGKGGSLRTDGIRTMRNMLPAISLLGAAMGNKILSGRISMADLRPACIEWGTSDLPAHQLTEHLFLTRRDDFEGRGEEDKHTGMIATTEALKQGVVLHGGIDVYSHATELERSCLGRGIRLLELKGMLGADNRRGFGKVEIDASNVPDQQLYLDDINGRRDEIVAYLKEIDALAKDVIITDNGGQF